MTPYELKYQYQQYRPDGHFFDRKTMKFFRDTMKNYGCRDAATHWELYRKKGVGDHGRLYGSHYFDKTTFETTTNDPREVTHGI